MSPAVWLVPLAWAAIAVGVTGAVVTLVVWGWLEFRRKRRP